MQDCVVGFSAQASKKVRAILFTSYLYYLTISFRYFDVRGLRIYGILLSLHILLVVCRSHKGMKWFSRAII